MENREILTQSIADETAQLQRQNELLKKEPRGV